MEAANEIMKQVIPILMIPINDYLRYIISCMKYVRNMCIKMTELKAARVGVEEHLTRNTSSHLEVPTNVDGWLKDVGKIIEKFEKVPSDVNSCFNLKIRHTVGRNAFNITEEIDSAMRRHSLITWTDHPIPLGRVLDSMKASTSAPSTEHDDFRSREVTFKEALKALGPNHKGHMVALCGMGGVGKTTMMKKIKNVVEKRKMFDYVVVAVIGEKTDPIALQKAVADYLHIELNESTKLARADKLCKWFKDNSDGGKKKFLVILDDVWQSVDLEDIGLSTPFPNQGVNFKVLLTSRKRDICTMMGVEADLILNVKVLEEEEAQKLFLRFVEISDQYHELHQIGVDIVKKCYGLPIVIKTMALTLRNKRKDSWKDALSRLEDHDTKNVANEVFEMSYRNLQDEETKAIFLLCGLFPEDFDIPTEELVRYGWGLNLFKKVYTIRKARTRSHACIERLLDSNLLIESNDIRCVKIHDLVRTFVLDMYCTVEHASIVNHGNMPGWTEYNMADSCNTISLTCKSMYGFEFPGDLKFPNLTVLKLMHGDKSLRFPQDFYQAMEKLRVISYDKMKYPLLPSSPQCSTNIRVLHLHECSLRMFDCSCIGKLLNLEVLSFFNSNIEWLPSTIGNLKKLRLLDLRYCDRLRIEQGVLKNLVKLEELYIGNTSAFTEANYNEMAERSNNLSTLEFEFFNNKSQVKNMSFENLERFKISVGCPLLIGNITESSHSYENTLQLVTKKGEVFDSNFNELFVKTEVLCLSIDGMNDLEDVKVKSTHPPQSFSFYNLRVLVVSKCIELRYLFKLCVANTLSSLEHLEICECDNMEELIHTGIGASEEETITFPKLKFLYLGGLPKLLGLCLNVNIIELPQLVELKLQGIPGFTSIYPQNKLETCSLLKEEVVIPNLETLQIDDMENLEEIWPCELSRGEKVKLREIELRNCDKLVNLFPHNPMSLLHHLEELNVKKCSSIESLFNIDLDCDGAIGPEDNNNLRNINAVELGKLREVWRIKGADNSRPLVRGFQAVERIYIRECERFRNVFTPITTNFDLGALLEILIYDCRENKENRGNHESEESRQEEEQTDILSEEETLQEGTNSISNGVFASCPIHSFHNLRKLVLEDYERVEVVFEIESPTSRELVTTHHNQNLILPNLEELNLRKMGNMSHVWKCNWNKFFALPKQQSQSPFHNLTTIYMYECKSIKYLFSPLIAELLSNLKEVMINECVGIEEVVSNRDDEDEEMTISTHTSTILFPQLDSLSLGYMNNLKCIGGGGAKDGSNEIYFNNTTTTTTFLHQFELSKAGGFSWSLCQYSREIIIEGCDALLSVIPCYAAGQMQKLQVLKISSCKGMKEVFENSGCDEGNGGIPRVNNTIMLLNLKILEISNCSSLEHIFTFSALESLRQLQELTIKYCKAMKVIVKKEEDEYGEQQTKTTLKASSSKEIVVFPRLTSIVLKDLPELLSEAGGVSWSLCQYSREIRIRNCDALSSVIPCYREGQMQKLQVLRIWSCDGMKEVFETKGTSSNKNKSGCEEGNGGIPRQDSFIMLPNLKILEIHNCGCLEHTFTFSALESLRQLEELMITYCKAMKVIVKKEENASSKEVVVFPRLKSIELVGLPKLEGFFLGKNEFRWPSLDDVTIKKCPQMSMFAPGGSTSPKLKYIKTSFGIYSVDNDGLNFQTTFPATSEGMPWSFHNLIELHVEHQFVNVKKIIPSSKLLKLQKLQKIHVGYCFGVEEVFETLEAAGRNGNSGSGSGFDESSQTTTTTLVNLPNLTQVELEWLPHLRHIWKRNQGTTFEYPNLTRVDINQCKKLKHVFTSSMAGGLLQLQELRILNCRHMEEVIGKDTNVVVEAEEFDGERNEILVLPRLKSLKLQDLPCLKGFSLGKEDFSFPLLDTLEIFNCPAITTFTKGNSATPQLKEIEINFGLFYAEEDINSSIIKIKQGNSKKTKSLINVK
ncbi:unnamed protein product [Lactuca virosa]|uniref:AAA+ ATPase domain-containing protein n=1 Tax=Lactuca virosa TaxID=75947 RepID=A0AAU9NAM3_9ASTR|nr:unnamed protein product [Lactuca virosa]